jgi:hypothetical protein
MGNFYTNCTLRGVTQRAAADVLGGRACVVTPVDKGTVVVFDEESDEQDRQVIASLAAELSGKLRCSLLVVMNHDDDVLWYQLYADGRLVDEYDSSPGYFDSDAEPSAPSGGDAVKLCLAFDSSNEAEVDRVLRKSSFDDDGFVFAFQRHAALVSALGISVFGVGTAYASFDGGMLPEGLAVDGVMRTV